MLQFNFPTTILFGQDSLNEFAIRLKKRGLKKPLLVTDTTVVKLGLADQVLKPLSAEGIHCTVFDGVHPNPIEEDVEKGAKAYHGGGCDSVIALGGGSPIDTAKVILIAVTHGEPLISFDDTQGGSAKIREPLPPLFAIPTTAGTGSEVGRSGVIIMRENREKTIFFHPALLPQIAVLAPQLTAGLPPLLTAATGIDAFTHCLEAYFSPAFHPIADGIALEGIRLILKNLPIAVKNGSDLQARGEMQLAASMGATAFQKGLGMIHSLAHPLSAECNLHHGLANALMLPRCIHFLENSALTDEQKAKFERVLLLFKEQNLAKGTLSLSCLSFFKDLGIASGLQNYGVTPEHIELLSTKAFKDSCHQGNMIPVNLEQLKSIYVGAMGEA